LHVSPEAAVGGTLALVRDGDKIELDVRGRRIQLHVPESELARRRAELPAAKKRFARGYSMLYSNECTQAHEGCDFRFLEFGPATAEPDIY
jgi:dihydroxy-acid dehydratase